MKSTIILFSENEQMKMDKKESIFNIEKEYPNFIYFKS